MNYSRFSRERFFNLGLILVGWTLYGFFFASQNYVRQAYFARNPNFQNDLALWLTCGYSWAILTLPILYLARRFPFSRENWHRALSVHIPASVFFSVAVLSIFVTIRIMLGYSYSLSRFQGLIVDEIHSCVLVYFGILGLKHVSYLLYPGARDHRQEPRTSPTRDDDESRNEPSEEIAQLADVVNGNARAFAERFSVKKGNRIVFINVDEIDSVTSEGNYVKIHSNGESHLLRETMKGMEQKLDPKQFLRVRRSAIVRIEQIKELHPLFNGEFDIVLKNGMKLSSSRRYRKNLNGLLKT